MPEPCKTCDTAPTCGGSCPAVPKGPDTTTAQKASRIQKIIAVVSGKGGVGKSTVSALLAVELRRRGLKVGILDADITGPSIPRLFAITDKAAMAEEGMLPAETQQGIKVMSLNLIVANEDDPVIWRGPILSQLVSQFWTEVVWGELDYLILDLPPGTGDVPISIFQVIPVDGVVVVSSPQQLAGMIVRKATKMVKMYNKPFYGLVENMAFFTCKTCATVHNIFGPSRGEGEALKSKMPFLGRLPLDPDLTALADSGRLEDYCAEEVVALIDQVLSQEARVLAEAQQGGGGS